MRVLMLVVLVTSLGLPGVSQSYYKLIGLSDKKNNTQSSAEVEHESALKAIIFDIGNVLVQVDLNLWTPAFKKIGVHLPEDVLKNPELRELIYKYSEGKMNTKKFISEFSHILGIEEIPLDKFKLAWNFVIRSLYTNSIHTLQEFRTRGYAIYALSDNNEMHTAYIEELYRQLYPNKKFLDLFDKVYLSQRTGYRKNANNAWLQILNENKLKPKQCLFVDDMSENTNRAKKLGFYVLLYTPQSDMHAVLKKISEIEKKQALVFMIKK